MPSRHQGAPRASRTRFVAIALAAVAVLTVAPSALAAEPASVVAPDGSGLAVDATISPATYYLRLLNCSRTGGYVNSNGSCSGYGSGRYSKYVAPIRLSYGITSNVARPYARLLAVRGRCAHNLDGDPGYRLRRAGYRPSWWGENIGCRDGSTNVLASILASHRAFQAEKASNGGHWRNIKNAMFRYVGIGVAKYGTRIRLVVDFYRPG